MQPMTILEKVKEFLIRLVKDRAFIEQLQASKDEQTQTVLQDAGYSFTQEEFETATIKLLDLKERDEFHELTEAELVGAIGGVIGQYPIIQPLYGVVVDPPPGKRPRLPYPWKPPIQHPYPWKPPIQPQPMYGVVIDPIVQPMYSVIISPL